VIKPDFAVKVRRTVPFDRAAALLVGVLAVMAALLSFVQMSHSHASGRATVQAARLSQDIAARISASSQAVGFVSGAQLEALGLGIEGSTRWLAASSGFNREEMALGLADQAASDHLQEVIERMSATSGGPPVDAYTAGLVKSTIEEIQAELTQQQAQVAIASEEGRRGRLAVLGLSFAALSGVMVGLAAVLREGRPGWTVLLMGWAVASVGGIIAALAVF
jgi:hypothetical protein